MTNPRFEKHEYRIFEKKNRPLLNKYYKVAYGPQLIMPPIRYDKEDNNILDREFAIDVTLQFTNGLLLNGQEKSYQHDKAKWKTATVEYEQNWRTGEPGDWFKGTWQFYTVCCVSECGTYFLNWAILNWPNVVLATLRGEIKWWTVQNSAPGLQSSFKATYIANLPDYCIWSSYLNPRRIIPYAGKANFPGPQENQERQTRLL